jgi:hypothetical protein
VVGGLPPGGQGLGVVVPLGAGRAQAGELAGEHGLDAGGVAGQQVSGAGSGRLSRDRGAQGLDGVGDAVAVAAQVVAVVGGDPGAPLGGVLPAGDEPQPACVGPGGGAGGGLSSGGVCPGPGSRLDYGRGTRGLGFVA